MSEGKYKNQWRRDRREEEGGETYERMPFGKHRGERLEDLPTEYLNWCLANFDESPLKARLQEVFDSRFQRTLPEVYFDGEDFRIRGDSYCDGFPGD